MKSVKITTFKTTGQASDFARVFFEFFDAKDLGFYFASGYTHYQVDDTFPCVLYRLGMKSKKKKKIKVPCTPLQFRCLFFSAPERRVSVIPLEVSPTWFNFAVAFEGWLIVVRAFLH